MRRYMNALYRMESKWKQIGKGIEGKQGGSSNPPSSSFPGNFPPKGSKLLRYANIGAFALLTTMLVERMLRGDGKVKKMSVQQYMQRIAEHEGISISSMVISGNHVKVIEDPEQIIEFNIGSLRKFEEQLKASRLGGIEEDDAIRFLPRSGDRLQRVFSPLLTIFVMSFIWIGLSRIGSMIQGGRGANMFQVGKSKAKLITNENNKIKFKDVAGLLEAKEELQQFVSFLKQPAKFKKLGAKIPKGLLLVGPPGTGKTLIAKAIAGESNVPFYSISGSDFLEMFVGVGPSRVRDLFKEARQHSSCIVFIDEIDAIGRKRDRGGFMGGSDERENTLNALLVEMDGFEENEGVVLLAGTNRPDILDKALLRPGRFDKQIHIGIPDLVARKEIFAYYLGQLKGLDPEVEVEALTDRMAELTVGFSGADISNICNESAIVAARKGKTKIEVEDLEDALDRVIGGIEHKDASISKDEKYRIAVHEAGHIALSHLLPNADRILKASIVPRSNRPLGYTQYKPKEKFLYSKEEITDRMCMLLGGKVMEELTFQDISTGAADDLHKVTQLAYDHMIGFGFSPKVGPLAFKKVENQLRVYGDHFSQLVDDEVRGLMSRVEGKARSILSENKPKVLELADLLLSREYLRTEDIDQIIGSQ